MIDLSLQKKFSSTDRFKLDVALQIPKGTFLAIQGPSGAGKTTLLRLIAGLEKPDSGFLRVGDKSWNSPETYLHPQERSIGYVFQDYALFPNMTVRRNLNYAQESGKQEHLDELLQLMGIADLADRRPNTLSGGQKQRVALARALVRRPDLLLLDEPLSALDTEMRRKLQDDILKLHRRFNTTAIMVSHSTSEIFRLADMVVILENGTVQKTGPVSEVFIGKQFSGKFRFEAEVLQLERSDAIFIVTLSVGNHLAKIVATEDEIADIAVGDVVLVSSKAFNPLLIPLRKGR